MNIMILLMLSLLLLNLKLYKTRLCDKWEGREMSLRAQLRTPSTSVDGV